MKIIITAYLMQLVEHILMNFI